MRTVETKEETIRKSFVRILLTTPFVNFKDLRKTIIDEKKFIKKNGKPHELEFVNSFLKYLNACEREKNV